MRPLVARLAVVLVVVLCAGNFAPQSAPSIAAHSLTAGLMGASVTINGAGFWASQGVVIR
jgi:hypothetical protein